MIAPLIPCRLASPLCLALMTALPLAAQAGQGTPALSLPPAVAFAPCAGGDPGSHPDQEVGQRLDVTQAMLMLDFLEGVSGERHEPERLDAVMTAEGTELIVGQMNLARRASMAQYRTLLTGLVEGKKPEIEPVDSTARSRNGVVGLLDNVWPLLTWGLGRTETLRERVLHLEGLDFYERAHALASRFLPDSIAAPPRVFAVIGGRAGAAKISPDRIYLDVLVYSYRDRETTGFPADDELIRTIGHEMHHMGYRAYLDRKMESLDPGGYEALLFDFLSGLLSEGAATYLVSHDRKLSEMYERRSTREYLENHQDLIATSEQVLQAIVDGRVRSVGQYEEATADMLGMWLHSAGSLMLGVIDQAGGLERVMEVVAEPGRLLVEYNRAARSLGPESDLRLFDDQLAASVMRLLG